MLHAWATRLEVEQILVEVDLRLRTQEAPVLFPKGRHVEPFILSPNKCKF